MNQYQPVSLGKQEFVEAVDWISDTQIALGHWMDDGISSLNLRSRKVAPIEYPPELEGFGFESFTDRRIFGDTPVKTVLENPEDDDEYAIATITRNKKLTLDTKFRFESGSPTVFQIGKGTLFFADKHYFRLGFIDAKGNINLREIQLEPSRKISREETQILRVWPISASKAVMLRAEDDMHLAAYELSIRGPKCGQCTLLWKYSAADINDACCRPKSGSFAVFYTDQETEANVVMEFSSSGPTTFDYEPDASYFNPKPFYVGKQLWYFSSDTSLCRMHTAKQKAVQKYEFEDSVSIRGLRGSILAVEDHHNEIFRFDLKRI